MQNFTLTLIILFAYYLITINCIEEGFAKMYLCGLNQRAAMRDSKNAKAQWNYYTNITETNHNMFLNIQKEIANETNMDWKEVIKFDWKNFIDPDTRRQFAMFSRLGIQGLPTDKLQELNKIISTMTTKYSTAKICSYKDRKQCNMKLTPDLIDKMSNSRDPQELEYIWKEWRHAVGGNLKSMFRKYVDLMNEAAKINNKNDAGEMWLENYETESFKEIIQSLWLDIKPLYLQLHAYIRFKLGEFYGDIVPKEGPIPAHLLGNMWAQSWDALYNFTAPFPDRKILSITDKLKQQNHTPLKLFQLAESFFVSLNFSYLPQSFWNKSILERPSDREVDCQPSSWDFYNGHDFRVKICSQINEYYFIVSHSLLATIFYYIQYKDQPHIYKQSATDAFIFGLSEGLTLPIRTGKYLSKIGILQETQQHDDILNILYRNALFTIPFMPYSYIVELWRWQVFSGKISSKNYNCKWWQLRNNIQGVQAPVERTEQNLDPISKYHIVANEQYLLYFVSSILQFQMYKALCIVANEYEPGNPKKPLCVCDFSGNNYVGDILKSTMVLGASKPWPVALEKLTGEKEMNASAFIEYFSPLMNWLTNYNKKYNVVVGWKESKLK